MKKALSIIGFTFLAVVGLMFTILFLTVGDKNAGVMVAILIGFGLFFLISKRKKVHPRSKNHSENHQTKSEEPILDTIYPIHYYSSNPSKTFNFTEEEKIFFTNLHSTLTPEENSKIKLYRLSNGSIEPYFDTYPLGKVKLQGRKLWMQVLIDTFDVHVVEGTFYELCHYIPFVAKYIRTHLGE